MLCPPFLYVIFLLFPNSTTAQSEAFPLNSDSSIVWQFRKAGDSTWHDAIVPGTIHTDLLTNKMIPDPFYRDNESKVQWVENEDWEYQTFFNCPDDILQSKHIELQFDGLDTYADVYLNDSLILRADNMFRKWAVDITDIVIRISTHAVARPSGRDNDKKRLESRTTTDGIDSACNHLLVHFYSSVKKGKELATQLDYKLPGDENGKALERKAQYQFGWDWGPRLVTCGVWKSVMLIGWHDFKVSSSSIVVTDASDSSATLRSEINLAQTDSNSAIAFFSSIFEINESRTTKTLYSDWLRKYDWINWCDRLKRPKLWWINGAGEQFLYNCNIHARNDFAVGEPLNEITSQENLLFADSFKFGIRVLKLIQQSDYPGSTFYFQLNGQPLFIKGANIIPPDNFLPRIKIEDYKRLIDDAVACHMNMLRVWGGGAYLPDEFYDYCDQKGILIWQDFMFAGTMVPGDSAFVENVKQEAIDQVIRLRNHPCIALWCGNNEINEAWNNWGFKDQNILKSGVNEKIWNDYQRIFDTILPQVVQEYAPGSFYYESSPSIGWGHKESLQQGDSHYWGVWWGNEPFSSYENHVGRFMSEYGFQSLPSMDCFYEFASPDDWKKIPLDKKTASNVLNTHQKHSSGYEIINDYMKRDYKVPGDFEKYVYVSQLLQRDGMATAIEAHRRAKPYCMGTLYWQLNDCWPVTSWSSEDYYGNWKALQYALQHDLYKTFLISMKEENDSVSVYVVSDSSKDLNARLRITLLSFDGKQKVSLLDSIIHLPANSSNLIFKFPIVKFLPENKVRDHFLHAGLSQDEEVMAEKNFFFSKPKDLLLSEPNLRQNIQYSRMKSSYEDYPNVYTINLHADAFARDVFLSYDFEDVKFSDNFFDLLPGETKTLIMYTKQAIDDVNMPPKIISLRDTY